MVFAMSNMSRHLESVRFLSDFHDKLCSPRVTPDVVENESPSVS